MINISKKFGDIIYTPETATNEAISKVETHTPKIEAPDVVKSGQEFKVKISVGPHSSTVNHSIRYLKFYFNEENRVFNPIHIASIVLEPEYTEPKLELVIKLKKSGVLYVLEYCNLHGLWEARKEIKVE